MSGDESTREILSVPATFGQKSIHRAISQWPRRRLPNANVPRVWPVPPGCTVDGVRAALAALEERHDALRTGFRLNTAGDVLQILWPAEPALIEVVDLGAGEYDGPEAVTDALMPAAFSLDRDRPWRCRIVTSGGAPVAVSVVLHHIAADGWGANVLRRDFLALLGGAELPPVGTDCTGIAERQRSQAWVPRRAAAAEHWRSVLAAAPPTAAEQPATATAAPRSTTLRAKSTLDVARRVAESARCTVHSVVLAAYCTVLAQRAAAGELVVMLISGNRIDPSWRAVASSFTQLTPVAVRVDPAEDLTVLAQRVHRDSLGAYRHGCYDVDTRAALGAEYGRSGVALDFEYFFNFSPAIDTGAAEPEPVADDEITVSAGTSVGYPTYLIAGNGHPSVFTLVESTPAIGEDQSIRLLTDFASLIRAAG